MNVGHDGNCGEIGPNTSRTKESALVKRFFKTCGIMVNNVVTRVAVSNLTQS